MGSPCPHVLTKVVEGDLTPLREEGVRILNYLNNWLILAQSREQLGDHRDLVLWHLSQLGLRVNWEKSKLSPVQRTSFLGVELDSVSMTAHLTEERAQAVLNCLSSFRGRNVVPLDSGGLRLGVPVARRAVPPGRWRTAPLWQTSAELRAGLHRTPLQDSTISASIQFLPVCWVTGNRREELAGVSRKCGAFHRTPMSSRHNS